MANRTVTDTDGRAWECATQAGVEAGEGRDVVLSCTTPSVSEPIRIKVGWQWEKMAESGLARLVSQASPVPRH